MMGVKRSKRDRSFESVRETLLPLVYAGKKKKNKKVRNHWKFNPKSYKKEKLFHNNLNSKVKKSKKINSNQFRNKFRDQFGMEEYENSQKSKSCTHERLLFNCLSASFITTQRQRDTQASIIQGEMKFCSCDSV